MAHLKVHKIKASIGTGHRADWSDTERNFRSIRIEAAGRGWAATHVMCFLETKPNEVEVEVLHIDHVQKWAMVALKSNNNDLTAKFVKRPYVRVNGTSGPQIMLGDDYTVKALRRQYGVQGFSFYDTDGMKSHKEKAQIESWASSKEWFEERGITFEQFCMDRVVVKLSELRD
jgi:hypothetical protein